jgi:hypothetical protein
MAVAAREWNKGLAARSWNRGDRRPLGAPLDSWSSSWISYESMAVAGGMGSKGKRDRMGA